MSLQSNNVIIITENSCVPNSSRSGGQGDYANLTRPCKNPLVIYFYKTSYMSPLVPWIRHFFTVILLRTQAVTQNLHLAQNWLLLLLSPLEP